MNIRTSIASVAVAAMATTASAFALAPGSATGSADRAGTPFHSTTYVAHELPGQFAMDDLAAPNGGMPDIGDMLAFTNSLTRAGKTVGRVSNVAVGVDSRRHLFQADGTVILRHGRVEYAGIVSQQSSFTMAVTGGTGRYVGASGTLTFANVNGRQLLTLRINR